MKYPKQPNSTVTSNNNSIFAAIELSEKSWLLGVHTIADFTVHAECNRLNRRRGTTRIKNRVML